MLIVVSLTAVLGGMAVIQIEATKPALVGDGAMRVILTQVKTARELAIKERRFMRLAFVPPNVIQVLREEVPGGTTTVVSQQVLEGAMEFRLMGTPDTPDIFGNGHEIEFGSVTNVKFTPEGTMVDQDGNSANGTIFLGQQGKPRSARAVTVLGSTGRIRGYKWDGRNWRLV